MDYAVVTVLFEHQKRRDLALPINVNSQVLSGCLAIALGQPVGENYMLAVQVGDDLRKIPLNASLGDLGILCGATLALQVAESVSVLPQEGAFFQSLDGSVLPVSFARKTIGRSDLTHGIFADIDLGPFDQRKYSSRRHAVIEKQGDRYLLTDIGSSHGTFVNSNRLVFQKPTPLQDGDLIEFGLVAKGGVQLTFHSG